MERMNNDQAKEETAKARYDDGWRGIQAVREKRWRSGLQVDWRLLDKASGGMQGCIQWGCKMKLQYRVRTLGFVGKWRDREEDAIQDAIENGLDGGLDQIQEREVEK